MYVYITKKYLINYQSLFCPRFTFGNRIKNRMNSNLVNNVVEHWYWWCFQNVSHKNFFFNPVTSSINWKWRSTFRYWQKFPRGQIWWKQWSIHKLGNYHLATLMKSKTLQNRRLLLLIGQISNKNRASQPMSCHQLWSIKTH